MIETFNNLLATQSESISILRFIVNLVLSSLLAILLSFIYAKYGNSLSNRKQFGRTFLLMTMTTMLIITVVKSSLALSLGLVGALSIVRFRTAIKEPEELGYMFLSIAVGLGLGADQTTITIIAYLIIITFIIITKIFSQEFNDDKNLNLTIQSRGSQIPKIDIILEILKKYCNKVDLRRLDETNDLLEASFMIEAHDFILINKAKNELKELNDDMKITLLDNKGLL